MSAQSYKWDFGLIFFGLDWGPHWDFGTWAWQFYYIWYIVYLDWEDSTFICLDFPAWRHHELLSRACSDEEAYGTRGSGVSPKQLHFGRGKSHQKRSRIVFWKGRFEVRWQKCNSRSDLENILRSFKTCQQHWGSSVRQRGNSNKIGNRFPFFFHCII